MSADLTQLLIESGTDPDKRATLFVAVYEELRHLARRELAGRAGDQTLGTGPLVHEAYFKLFPSAGGNFENRRHFFGAAARAMRQVIIEYARARLAERRGGGVAALNLDALDPAQFQLDDQAAGLVQLDRALTQLAEIDPRAVEVVEMRFFAGLEVADIARALGISEPTVKRDTRFARDFLQAALAS